MAGISTGILATGSYLPDDEVTNADLAKKVSVTPEWIEQRTLIKTRRYAAPDQATSDLAALAAKSALERSGIAADDIAYLIVSTSTGDFPLPPTAYVVQDAIGTRRAACMDINVVCSGFVYGVALARGLLATCPDGYALVVAADLYSRSLDYDDFRSSILFGDGAGAVVLGPVPPGYGILEMDLASRGDEHNLIRIEAGGSRLPSSAETVAAGGHYVRMEGHRVRDFVLEQVPPALRRLVARAGFDMDQVDHFVPHQPNGILLGKLAERLDVPQSRVHLTLGKYANVGSASVPVTLDDANESGALNDGDLVLLTAFGAGMAIGSCLLRWAAGTEKEA
ncbi:3-oxoacyl-ACP synthase III family protein [Amycolatopsis sp. NPDC058278]|uniref:3-oxoacyl-ACP synthase III family protein n=1 Tax=Amycolatopsis sp. NPDC058278 TaxID=3346417 RepID=UPI0036DAA8D6